MAETAIPALLQRGSGTMILVLGIGLVAVYTWLVTRGAQRAPLSERLRAAAPLLAGSFLAVWLGVAIVFGEGTNFQLVRNDVRPLITLAIGLVPMLAAIAVLAGSATARAIVAATPPAWWIRVQTYRIAGLMFLYPFLYYGLVPAGFAVPAGIGDFVTGLLAPVVAAAVDRRRPGAVTLAAAWNVFGIADLIVAPVAAVLSGAQVLGMYPLALVPLFIGPPLGILTHAYSLWSLRVAGRPEAAGAGPSRTAARSAGADHVNTPGVIA
jgi:hypothetical protein